MKQKLYTQQEQVSRFYYFCPFILNYSVGSRCISHTNSYNNAITQCMLTVTRELGLPVKKLHRPDWAILEHEHSLKTKNKYSTVSKGLRSPTLKQMERYMTFQFNRNWIVSPDVLFARSNFTRNERRFTRTMK